MYGAGKGGRGNKAIWVQDTKLSGTRKKLERFLYLGI